MFTLKNTFSTSLVALFFVSHAASAKPLCQANEEVVFSCETTRSHETVSVCISPDLSQNSGYMYFTTAKKGGAPLKFPKEFQHPQALFKSGHLTYAGATGGSYISFVNQGQKSIVYSVSGSFGFERQGFVTAKANQSAAQSSQLCKRSTVVEQESAVSKLMALKLEGDESISKNGLPQMKSRK